MDTMGFKKMYAFGVEKKNITKYSLEMMPPLGDVWMTFTNSWITLGIGVINQFS
jgi:hypothetical protein